MTIPTNNPYLIRAMGPVTMPDGSVITNAGEGAVCLECHQNRNGSATNQLVQYPLGQYTWFGGSSFGVHDNPQGDMIEGVNANTYGQTIPNSAHLYSVTNLCVGCHMQTLASTDPGLLHVGGHTFEMSYNAVTTNGAALVTNTVNKVDVCVQCHGPISSFNFLVGDLEGNGVIEGPQSRGLEPAQQTVHAVAERDLPVEPEQLRGGWLGEDNWPQLDPNQLAAEVPDGRLQLAVCQQ